MPGPIVMLLCAAVNSSSGTAAADRQLTRVCSSRASRVRYGTRLTSLVTPLGQPPPVGAGVADGRAAGQSRDGEREAVLVMVSKELAEQLVGATGGLHWLSSVKAAAAGTSASVWIPVVAAVIAATAAGWSALLQRRTGKEATATARKSAEAAQASADASHRSATAAEEMGSRTDAAALAERYQDAASQLGHDKAAVRLAGVYAMSRLADDWREERQTCIDVLCAYLRLPWQDTADSPVGRDELQVRRTIVSVINHHVAEDSKVSWVENDFDFTRAQLREFILEGCIFAGHVSFSGAEFTGECRLIDIAFRGRAVFDSCTVVDRMQLAKVGAESDGRLTFVAARIPSGAELKIEPNTEDPQDVNVAKQL